MLLYFYFVQDSVYKIDVNMLETLGSGSFIFRYMGNVNVIRGGWIIYILSDLGYFFDISILFSFLYLFLILQDILQRDF